MDLALADEAVTTPAILTFRNLFTSSADEHSYTTPVISLGAANPTRCVLFVVYGRALSLASQSVNEISIAGINATELIEGHGATTAGGAIRFEEFSLWGASVGSLTGGVVNCVFDNLSVGCYIATLTLDNAITMTPQQIVNPFAVSDDNMAFSLDIPAGGCALAASLNGDAGAPPSTAWTASGDGRGVGWRE